MPCTMPNCDGPPRPSGTPVPSDVSSGSLANAPQLRL